MRVTVDLSRCQGYGNCVSAAPEVFDLADNGLAVVLDAEPGDERRDEIEQAMKLCPVAAIELQD
jgi:ferredoxin